jgi:hypothetical protein
MAETVERFAQRLRKHYESTLAAGFGPREAFDLTVAYQSSLLMFDVLGRTQRGGSEPWRAP